MSKGSTNIATEVAERLRLIRTGITGPSVAVMHGNDHTIFQEVVDAWLNADYSLQAIAQDTASTGIELEKRTEKFLGVSKQIYDTLPNVGRLMFSQAVNEPMKIDLARLIWGDANDRIKVEAEEGVVTVKGGILAKHYYGVAQPWPLQATHANTTYHYKAKTGGAEVDFRPGTAMLVESNLIPTAMILYSLWTQEAARDIGWMLTNIVNVTGTVTDGGLYVSNVEINGGKPEQIASIRKVVKDVLKGDLVGAKIGDLGLTIGVNQVYSPSIPSVQGIDEYQSGALLSAMNRFNAFIMDPLAQRVDLGLKEKECTSAVEFINRRTAEYQKMANQVVSGTPLTPLIATMYTAAKAFEGKL